MIIENLSKTYSPSLIGQVLSPLFYFDIFSYPLTKQEILQFSNLSANTKLCAQELEPILDYLLHQKYLYQIENFYLLSYNPDWVLQRKENNKRAELFLARAQKMTRFMRCFPYVRAIFISGSLSKNVMPEDGDIDYFIVTQPNRLWVARSFLVLFKKIFLFNSHKYFCVNYFVDENCLEIEEKNRFTATEVATLLPLYGAEIYAEFWQKNRWIESYYPVVQQRCTKHLPPTKRTLSQRLVEPILNLKLGDWLDSFFMKKTIQHWNKKFGNLHTEDFDIALKSRRNVSKHHPQLFQQRVIKAFEERVQNFENTHQINLELAASERLLK